MAKIKGITAREILDSRGNPTIEVTVYTESAQGKAAVPSGASTGKHEALELRDGGKRFLGKGVRTAISNVEKKIAPQLKGLDCRQQKKIDEIMLSLDGTENKAKLGANAILGISLACARAAANYEKEPLYKYLSTLSKTKIKIPRPFLNVINGGEHADNNISFQEFMIAPNLGSFNKNMQAASEIYHLLKKKLHQKYGAGATNVGDEGGFAPAKMKKTEEALQILMTVINEAGYRKKVELAIDVAASEFYHGGKYSVDGKNITKEGLLQFYLQLVKKYPLISIEDPFDQDDFSSFAELRKKSEVQIVADDLTVTNLQRIKIAVMERSCNCLLLKVNQIGTLTEAINAAKMAFQHDWKVMVSHRSGETEDTFIADLAVALGCGQIKSGAPCRGERTAKYNRLLEIERKLRK